MKLKQFETIHKLWLVALLIALCTITSATIVTYYIKHQFSERVLDDLHQTLDASIYQYKLLLNDKKRLTQFWAEDTTLYNTVRNALGQSRMYAISSRSWHNLLKSIRRSENLLGIEVLDRYGDVILTEDATEQNVSHGGQLDLDILNLVWKGSLYASEPVALKHRFTNGHSSSNTSAAIIIMAPIKNAAQETVGILAFYIDPHHLTGPVFNLNQVGLQGQTYAINDQGTLLTHVKHTDALVEHNILHGDTPHPEFNVNAFDPGVNLTESSSTYIYKPSEIPLTTMAESLTQHKAGRNIAGYRDYRGEKVVGVWRWDNELNMGFVSEANYSEIFSAYFAIRDAIIIGAGLVVLLTFITTEGMRRYNNRHISTLALRDQIIDNSADGIVVIDRQSIIRIANPKVCELFGYALGELDGNNVACLIPSPSQEEHDKYVAKSALYGSRIFDRRRNLRGLRRDGSTFPIDLVVTKMDIADNEYFIGLIRDITEMIEKENQLLEARNRAQEALSIAENANNARSLFLSKMNHELRTPLNAILGFSDLLELDCEDPEALEHIHIIKSSGQHLLTLINDIVDWAKAESGRIQLELIPVNIAHIIEEACSDKRDILLEKKLTLTLDTHAINQYFILADPFRLKQAIDSLLQHAILFSQIETAIDIHFTCPDDVTAILTIHYLTDADKAFMNQALIDLFNNLDKVEAIEGSDIKLILARELIRLMGGQISIHHAENGETQIELTLSKANMTQNEEG